LALWQEVSLDRSVRSRIVVASLQDLSDRQRAEVLAGTARRFYRISIQVC
jgi:hypothetical protein